MDLIEENAEESKCGKPCDPVNYCDECSDYWNRMILEGFWDQKHHRWTNKGWLKIIK